MTTIELRPFAMPQADVHLPGLLGSTQIVARNHPHSVDILEPDRWGEPLDQMVSRVLNDDLHYRWAAIAPPDLAQAVDEQVYVTADQFPPTGAATRS